MSPFPPFRWTIQSAARLGAVLSFALLLGTGVGCASDKKTLAQANAFDSGLQPAEIKDAHPVADANINAYFQKIGDRIVASAKLLDEAHMGPPSHFKSGETNEWMFQPGNVQFHLVNSETLNAFTTGGQHVYVYWALFKNCQNEDDLAAVMSHEFAHVYCRHVQKGMNRQTAAMFGAGAAGVAGYAAGGQQYAGTGASLAQQVANFVNMGFTRDDEAQADEWGFKFYCRAGWDPQQFDHFFKTMIALGYDTKSASQSDHPTLKSRVEATEKLLKTWLPPAAAGWRQPPVLDQAGFDAIRARAAQLAANSPSDKSLANAKTLLQALPRSCWVPYEPEDQKQAAQELVKQAEDKDAKEKANAQSAGQH